MKHKNTNTFSIFVKKFLLLSIFVLLFFSASRALASETKGTIFPGFKYAFGENLGWINFGCDNCNVHITDTGLSGHAWSRQYGWINLSPDGGGVTNNCAGELGGKAWSNSLGWVDFSGAQINGSGKFTGLAGTPLTKAGRVNFSCDNCNVSTDWLQCALRESPTQVIINSITNNVVPSISANITITNEGSVDTEYQYEWCVVSDISNPCGGGNVFYSSGAKLIAAGQSWTTDKVATVPDTGTYYFKMVVYFGTNYSVASQVFTAVAGGGSGVAGSGVAGGGGGGGNNTASVCKYDSADFNLDHLVNSTDFSILLYFWKKNLPFSNIYVDINKDGKVDSIEFSIMLSQWGHKTTCSAN